MYDLESRPLHRHNWTVYIRPPPLSPYLEYLPDGTRKYRRGWRLCQECIETQQWFVLFNHTNGLGMKSLYIQDNRGKAVLDILTTNCIQILLMTSN